VRILVLRALGLGDLLTAVPALRALRDAYPQSKTCLACPRWLHELVETWQLADETFAVGPLEALPAGLHGADLAVNLHGRGPESTRLLLAARPRRFIAFRHADLPETRSLPRWRPGEHEVQRWCRLLTESSIPADPSRLELPVPPASNALRAGCTVLHSGASAASRRWPPERWASLARSELEAGRRVVLTGSDDERAACLRIAAAAGVPAANVLAGRTTPLELAALVGHAGLVVSGDTGVAHLATAFGTPSVVLFGPVPPSEWGPPAGTRRQRTLWAGRRGDPHASTPDPGLLALTPERVTREIDELRASSER
jgi:ADP-heptose:LPS heptosyltransferase